MGYLSGRNKGQKLVGCFQDISVYYQLPYPIKNLLSVNGLWSAKCVEICSQLLLFEIYTKKHLGYLI